LVTYEVKGKKREKERGGAGRMNYSRIGLRQGGVCSRGFQKKRTSEERKRERDQTGHT